MTDESRLYITVGKQFSAHETVKHSIKEYVRSDVHTNTVEGYFSIFKRSMKDVYQHCAEKHLHRYLAEFDFRYNNRAALEVTDTARAAKAMAGIEASASPTDSLKRDAYRYRLLRLIRASRREKKARKGA